MASENGNGLKFELEEIVKVVNWFKKEQFQKNLSVLSDGKVDEDFISKIKNKKIKTLNSEKAKALHQILNNPDLVTIHIDQQVARLTRTPDENKKKIKINNFIYIMPTTSDGKDWNALVEFAEELSTKKLFILPQTTVSHPKEPITKSPEELPPFSLFNQEEKSVFLEKLKELNKLIKFGKPEQWQLFIDTIEYSLIMVNGGSYEEPSGLKLRLGQEIEKFSISLLITHHELERVTSDPVLPKNTKFDLDKNDEANELNDIGNKRTHETQKIIGQQMFKLIIDKLQITNSCSSEEELFKKYADFKLLILLPNIVSLQKQTEDRLIQLKDEFKDVAFSDKFDSIVRINYTYDKMVKKWTAFIKSARKNKEIFHLIIHDECHWGAGKEQGAYKLLGFDNGDYHLDNNVLLPNLFTVMVSATPFNFFTSKDLQSSDILNWKKFLQHEHPQKENEYQGLKELRAKNKIVSVKKSEVKRNLLPLTINGFSEEFVQLINDYVDVLKGLSTSSSENANSTHEAVKKSIEENKLIVIRLSSKKDYVRPYEVAKIVLKKTIEKFNLKVEVVVHNSEGKNGLDLKFEEHQKIAFQNTKKRNPEQENDLIKDPQFSDYAGIPMIMIIVERGRMGDTFPPCVRFDLRARYLSPVEDFTSIVQDVGRAFGYNERPTLLLSQRANDFLGNVWDDEKDEISWEGLRKERKAVLGQHMKKSTSKKDENEPDLSEGDNESNNELQLFQQIFEKDDRDPVMLYGLGPSSFRHRMILKAEPQIGKTGAFLFLVYLFSKKIYKTNKKFYISELDNLTNQIYNLQTLTQTEELFKTEDGKGWHKTYLSYLPYAREKRKGTGVLEPAKWAAASLASVLLKSPNASPNEIRIADFGCGDQQFATFFNEEIFDQPTLEGKKIHLDSFDISPNPIPEVKTNSIFTITTYPGVNCSKVENFDAKTYDFIVMTCMLWGKGDSWKPNLGAALHALKESGKIFLAEFKERFPLENLQSLPNAGVLASANRLTLRRDLMIENFIAEFNAVAISKDDYDPNLLLQYLNR